MLIHVTVTSWVRAVNTFSKGIRTHSTWRLLYPGADRGRHIRTTLGTTHCFSTISNDFYLGRTKSRFLTICFSPVDARKNYAPNQLLSNSLTLRRNILFLHNLRKLQYRTTSSRCSHKSPLGYNFALDNGRNTGHNKKPSTDCDRAKLNLTLPVNSDSAWIQRYAYCCVDRRLLGYYYRTFQ